MMRNIFSVLFIVTLFYACTPHAYIKVMQPADVTIPPHIQKIGIINRSLASKDDKWLNILEGVLSGESIGADREGAEQAMNAVKVELERSGRYVVSLPAVTLNGNTANFDSPMDYSLVHDICQRHNLDGLVSMENFDSNSKINMSLVEEIIKLKDGTTQKVLNNIATANLQVTTRWRMYDDSTKNIVDSYTANNNKQFNAKGATPAIAQSGLPYKRNAINQCGFANGTIYGQRISPYWITVDRMYYKKGSDNLKLAAKYTKKNNWNEAIAIWKKEMSINPDKEIAGKACYNMAVACERDGNLQLALEYAQRSATQFSYHKAHSYINQINKRISDSKTLDYQMNGANSK